MRRWCAVVAQQRVVASRRVGGRQLARGLLPARMAARRGREREGGTFAACQGKFAHTVPYPAPLHAHM